MGYPNRLRSNNWKVSLTNMPSMVDKRVDMRIFDEYCRSLVIPDLNLDIVETTPFQEYVSREPMSRYNDTLNPLIVEFIVSEDLENYLYFYEWYMQLRSGETPVGSTRGNTIKSIVVSILDNQKEEIAKVLFSDCFPQTITSLNMTMGSSSEVLFSVNFAYSRMLLERTREDS